MDRLITGLALMMTFWIGFATGEAREHRRNAAIWSQFTSDAVARSVKADRN